MHPLGTLRWRLPTPESRRGHELRRALDSAIDSVAATRRNGFAGHDLLLDWVRMNDELGGTDADLRGTDLSNADLDRARLQNAKLRGANLRGASTEEVNWRSFELTGVRIDLMQAVQFAATHGAVVGD